MSARLRRAWLDALCLSVGFAVGWVIADSWVRGRLEQDAPGGLLEFG